MFGKLEALLYDAITWAILLFARSVLLRRPLRRFIGVLGGPGAGKGTVSKDLEPALGIAHLSMGDVLRRKDIQDEFGDRLAEMKRGGLVDDHLVIHILERELEHERYANGAILDGVPRTQKQARLLARMLAWKGCRVERYVLLELDEAGLIDRLSFRRVCQNESCGRIYHLKYSPPQNAGVCDACQSPLYQRPDDVPGVISERLKKYKVESTPLCTYLEDHGVLAVVKPTLGGTRQEVLAQVISALSG